MAKNLPVQGAYVHQRAKQLLAESVQRLQIRDFSQVNAILWFLYRGEALEASRGGIP
jgi:hypothetical protein